MSSTFQSSGQSFFVAYHVGVERDPESHDFLDKCKGRAIVTRGRAPIEEAICSVFRPTFDHRHKEQLFNATANKSIHVKLTGFVRECKGCMLAKDLRAPIVKKASHRIDGSGKCVS